MKFAFLFGIVLGFGGVLGGAFFYPLVDHVRIDSITTVARNGGRDETFLIRLPVDRIASVGSPETGLRGSPHPSDLGLPEGLGGQGLLVEHFKLRNYDGDVIGLASRHWTETGPEAATVWALSIPGRGAVALAGPGETASELDAMLRASGYVAGAAWSDDEGVELDFARDTTRVVAGSSEFGGVGGAYRETWTITGVSATGELRGTIEFATRVSRQ